MTEVIQWFVRFWREERRLMSVVLTLTVITIAVKTAYPIGLKYIVDKFAAGTALTDMHFLIAIYAAAGIVHEIFVRFLPYTRAIANLKFSRNIRAYYYNVFAKRNSYFFTRFGAGDLLTRLTDDIDGSWERIEWFSCSGIMRPIEAGLILLFTLGVMLSYSWQLTLWSFTPLPILVYLLGRSQALLIKYSAAKQQAISDCNALLENTLTGIRVVKSVHAEQEQVRHYKAALADRVNKEMDYIRMNQRVQMFSLFVNNAGALAAITVGGWLVLHGKFDLGTFLLFVLYLDRLVEPLRTLSWFYASTKQVTSYVRRLAETEKPEFTEPEEHALAEEISSLESITVENVEFYYTPSSKPLQRINFSAKQGQTVAIIGTIGSGKTTLLELIARKLTPTNGNITINKTTIQRINSKSYARIVGYVQQQALLFTDSIRGNICLGQDFSDEQIQQAIYIACLEREIAAMPKGLQTTVGQRGVTLSGGQKQRIAIARTVIRQPELLLLDDSISALDATTEELFWQRIRTYLPKTTVLVVTHRAATALQADVIYLLQDGKLHPLTHEQAEEYLQREESSLL